MTTEKTVLKFMPWIAECDSADSELTLVMDVEVGEEKDQAAFSLKALFQKKLEGAEEYIKANDSFRSDVVETLGYDIDRLDEIIQNLRRKRTLYMQLVSAKVYFKQDIGDIDTEIYDSLIQLYSEYNVTSVNENDSFTQSIMIPNFTNFDKFEQDILELGIDLDSIEIEK